MAGTPCLSSASRSRSQKYFTDTRALLRGSRWAAGRVQFPRGGQGKGGLALAALGEILTTHRQTRPGRFGALNRRILKITAIVSWKDWKQS